MNEEKLADNDLVYRPKGEFHVAQPKWEIFIGGGSFVRIWDDRKYPNFWHRFWMKVLLGWVVKKP